MTSQPSDADTVTPAVSPSLSAEPESPTPEASDVSQAGDPGPSADAGAEAAAQMSEAASESSESEGKRRVRLNPTFDPQQVKAVPSLTPSATTPTATAPPPAEPPENVPAEEPPAAAAAAAAEPADETPEIAPVVEAPAPPAADIPDTQSLDDEMEAEIAAALASGEIGEPAAVQQVEAAGEDAATAEAAADDSEPGEGTKLSGTVQAIHDDNVFLDFGLRLSGVVSKRQFAGKDPNVGDKVHVVVSKVDEDEGLLVCNLPRGAARVSGNWDEVSPGQVVECTVNGTNKGGLEVGVGSLRGFMPASQVDLGFVSDLSTFVGQKLQARVTEVNPGRRRLVVSRRELLQEQRAAAEQELMAHIEVGQTISGKVKTIKDYGAFVDLGGTDGFLHIGQISWLRIEHPSEVLSEGQSIDVKVVSIDQEKNRIGLSLRQLTNNPWANVESRYPTGANVSGKVTRTEAFGAFVELEPGVEGLVHISELDHQRVKRVTEVLNVGQSVTVQVLTVDPKKKRIGLSVKALKDKPVEATDEDLAPGGGQTYERKRKGDLKGGIGGDTPGGLFGDPNRFG